jgi:ferritin-like metal-binding protein YciE
MAEQIVRDLKLIQYLNEAYGTEKQLETALETHIAMTTRMSYKKRLRRHLTETKRHGREVERRVKQLGGMPDATVVPVPQAATGLAQAVQTAVGKAAAAAQGPVHVLRGTGEEEKQLKNAKTEYASEAEEIATYTAILSLAESVGDRQTAQLARGILREEQRMANFLERLIPTLTKAVARDEIPADQRDGGRRRGSTSRRRSRSGAASSGRRRSSSGRSSSRSSGRGRSSSGRSSSGRSSSGRSSSGRSSSGRSSSGRSSSGRSSSRSSGRGRSSSGSSSRGRSSSRASSRRSSR